jgi:Glycosyltransferase family 28 C-terminal domain/Monogalactosyldiacylglycerol (MGDG) synthase
LRKLTIVFHHAGGGHRNAAEALRDTLARQQNPWNVTLLDIQELLDPLDVVRRATGLRVQDTYNLILRKGWTRFTPQLLVVLQTTIRAAHSRIVKLLRAYWGQHPADLVVSVIPHFNREIAESLRANETHIPFVTVLTDLADYPPRFWIEPQSEYIIAGTERAREQALAMGHASSHIFRASGMILKPRFYQPAEIDRTAERIRLGLDPDRPTGIVLFGGHGSRVMLDIAKHLDRSDAEVQLILICGHNQKLAAEFKAMKTRIRILVEEFTPNVHYFMALSDFFIGKPGPGSISEALQLHLPVIVECNAKTLPQERYNAEWVTEQGFGIVVRSFREITRAVDELLKELNFAEFRRRVGSYSNRALFEIPEFIEQINSETLSSRMERSEVERPAVCPAS